MGRHQASAAASAASTVPRGPGAGEQEVSKWVVEANQWHQQYGSAGSPMAMPGGEGDDLAEARGLSSTVLAGRQCARSWGMLTGGSRWRIAALTRLRSEARQMLPFSPLLAPQPLQSQAKWMHRSSCRLLASRPTLLLPFACLYFLWALPRGTHCLTGDQVPMHIQSDLRPVVASPQPRAHFFPIQSIRGNQKQLRGAAVAHWRLGIPALRIPLGLAPRLPLA